MIILCILLAAILSIAATTAICLLISINKVLEAIQFEHDNPGCYSTYLRDMAHDIESLEKEETEEALLETRQWERDLIGEGGAFCG